MQNNQQESDVRFPWDQVYVINLERDKSRLEHITKELVEINQMASKHGGFVRVEAVDAEKLTRDDVNTNATFFCRNFCTRGTLACAMSHLKAYKIFLESSNETALILEDDAEFTSSIHDIKRVMKQVPSDYDILMVGHVEGSSTCRRAIVSLYAKTIGFHCRDTIVNKEIFIPDFFYGSHCYMISRSGARKLINLLDKQINWHYDITLAKLIHRKEIKGYAVYPSLSMQERNKLESRISTSTFPVALNYVIKSKVDLDMKSPVMQVMGVHINAWSLVTLLSGLVVNGLTSQKRADGAYATVILADVIVALARKGTRVQTFKTIALHYLLFTLPMRGIERLLK